MHTKPTVSTALCAAAIVALLVVPAPSAEPPSLAKRALQRLRAEQAQQEAIDLTAQRRLQLAAIEAKASEQGGTLRWALELLERIARNRSIEP